MDDPASRSGTLSGAQEQAGSFGRGQPCLLVPSRCSGAPIKGDSTGAAVNVIAR